jgi:hypothetical protein
MVHGFYLLYEYCLLPSNEHFVNGLVLVVLQAVKRAKKMIVKATFFMVSVWGLDYIDVLVSIANSILTIL